MAAGARLKRSAGLTEVMRANQTSNAGGSVTPRRAARTVAGSFGNEFDPPGGFTVPNKATWWPVWAKGCLQDYRQFAPVHRRSCNILFADGSVRGLSDANDEGLLNNGFPATGGFADDVVELTTEDIASSYSLSPDK